MSVDFILPDIGEGIVECELVEWRIKEGDIIVEDQPVADVSTDKALVEITSMHTGRVDKLYYQQGDIAKVHTPLFSIDVDANTGDNKNNMNKNGVNKIDVNKSSANKSNGQASDNNGQQHRTMSQSADIDDVSSDNDNSSSSISNDNNVNTTTGEQIIDFILPDIGEGIVECEVVEWQISEGDLIEEDQRVADVSTDKALVEITSMHTGRVVKLYYAQGETAKVHSPMFAIAVAGTGATTAPDTSQTATPVQTDSTPPVNTAARQGKKVLTTPAVRRIARENNLDLTLVPATGKNGRVLKEDVLNFLQQGNTATAAESTDQPSSAQPTPQQDRVEPIKGIRAVMAKTMMESVSSIPHFTYVDEVDMSRLIALRKELKADLEQQGIRLTMMPFFIKALSLAIKQYPILNSRINDDCTELHYLASHNIGIAVDSPSGLLVPNIKNVQNLNIIEIAQHSNRLTEQARAARLSPADLQGGTITISNVGAIGGTVATPIINKPQVAIVALGKVQSLPRFDADGNVCAQQIMTISWSGDHRVIDGATMARFSNAWKTYLENPSSMLMTMS